MIVADEIVALGAVKSKPGLDGVDLDDTPEMTKLSAEIEKSQSVSSPQPINWNLVEQCSRIILRDYVKHYQIAAYYGVSLIKIGHGILGVAEGANVFLGIFKNFWEDSIPPIKRKKGRFNALGYWLENVSQFVESYSGEPIPENIVSEAIDIISDLDSTMADIDEDNAHNLRPLLNFIRNLPTAAIEVKEVTPTKDVEVPIVETASSASTVASAVNKDLVAAEPVVPKTSTPVVVPVAENVEQKLKIAFNFLVEAADEIFTTDIFNQESYQYRRIGAWQKIKTLPYNDNNVTRIPAPVDEIRNSLEKLYLGNQFEPLIKAAEMRVTQYLYWLDLSYYSYNALVALKKQDVADAIVLQVKTFVSRLPGVTELCFDDNTPMSTAETKSWISSFAQNSDKGSRNTDGIQGKIKDVVSLGQTDYQNAISVLDNYIKTSSGMTKLRFESALAVVFVKNKRSDLAVGITDKVIGIIKEHSLSSWNEIEAAEVLSFAFDVYKAAEKLDKAAEVLTQLSILSPTLAITKSYVEQE